MNNYNSEEFTLTWGTRQGCPLSPILFDISLEPLAEAIRSDPSISGVRIGGENHIMSLFVDDMVLYLTNSYVSISSLMDLINSFGRISGLAINYSKSEIHLIALPVETRLKLQGKFDFR